MKLIPWFWPVLIILSGALALYVTQREIDSPLRPVITLWFLLVCPGMAFVRLLRLGDRFAEWSLSIALSLALAAIVAMQMVYTGLWSPQWGLAALVVVSLVGAILQLLFLGADDSDYPAETDSVSESTREL